MKIEVEISDNLYNDAKHHAKLNNRTVEEQIEFWVRLAIALEANPDLPTNFVKDILHGMDDESVPFSFSD